MKATSIFMQIKIRGSRASLRDKEVEHQLFNVRGVRRKAPVKRYKEKQLNSYKTERGVGLPIDISSLKNVQNHMECKCTPPHQKKSFCKRLNLNFVIRYSLNFLIINTADFL